jgi:hypothetical protein
MNKGKNSPMNIPPSDILHAFKESNQTASSRESYITMKSILMNRLDKYNQQMKRRLDVGKIDKTEYKVGEKIWLATKNLQPTKLSIFQPRYIGPFGIQKVYGNNSVKLDIPLNEKISKVYNMASIKKYKEPYPWMEEEI